VTLLLVELAVLAAPVAAAASTGGTRLRRYSAARIEAQLTIAGRGFYFSRTPDGVRGEPPPDASVREPRRPLGPDPLSAAAELKAES
jgi:hypothetical protein